MWSGNGNMGTCIGKVCDMGEDGEKRNEGYWRKEEVEMNGWVTEMQEEIDKRNKKRTEEDRKRKERKKDREEKKGLYRIYF